MIRRPDDPGLNEGVPCHAIPDGVHHAAAVYRDGPRGGSSFKTHRGAKKETTLSLFKMHRGAVCFVDSPVVA